MTHTAVDELRMLLQQNSRMLGAAKANADAQIAEIADSAESHAVAEHGTASAHLAHVLLTLAAIRRVQTDALDAALAATKHALTLL
jgi:hypothetical protein